ncbi:MAG: hypothetical protein ACNA8H_12775 [Anaerolineales bacterium]
MNRSIKISIVVLAILVLSASILWLGTSIARAGWGMTGYWPGSMMAGFPVARSDSDDQSSYCNGSGVGIMGGGMMGTYAGQSPGMMHGYLSSSTDNVDPLNLEQVEVAIEKYLTTLNDQGLVLGEVMIFDNHAYAQIIEVSTGIGALEVLVDPESLAVYPEPGPNMMWNLKYGMMSGYGEHGMMGAGMMGGWNRSADNRVPEVSAEMPITPQEAIERAQDYLNRNSSGLQVEAHADRFYGYYTLHTLEDGNTVGMLSVNGFSGQVFPHTWHGKLLQVSD